MFETDLEFGVWSRISKWMWLSRDKWCVHEILFNSKPDEKGKRITVEIFGIDNEQS